MRAQATLAFAAEMPMRSVRNGRSFYTGDAMKRTKVPFKGPERRRRNNGVILRTIGHSLDGGVAERVDDTLIALGFGTFPRRSRGASDSPVRR